MKVDRALPLAFAVLTVLATPSFAQDTAPALPKQARIVTASIGVILLSAGCAGYLFRPLTLTKRGLLWLASLLLLVPSTTTLLVFADFAGLALGAAIIAWEWMHCRPRSQFI